jgi:L-fuconolactonase
MLSKTVASLTPPSWHSRTRPIGSEELATSLAPLMTYCIEQFGPNRCMFESNFPVDKVSFSHHVLFNAFKRFSENYTPAARAALFHDSSAGLSDRRRLRS